MHFGSGGRNGSVSHPQTFNIHPQNLRHIKSVLNLGAKVLHIYTIFSQLFLFVVNQYLNVVKKGLKGDFLQTEARLMGYRTISGGRKRRALEDPVKNGACLTNVRPRRGL